jgi:hypothetical protein
MVAQEHNNNKPNTEFQETFKAVNVLLDNLNQNVAKNLIPERSQER